jgi:hypothetical protein
MAATTRKKAATRKRATKKKMMVKAKPGANMMSGGGWQLVKNGRVFAGNLIKTVNAGTVRVAIFKVPK